jgi:hypothetical protein
MIKEKAFSGHSSRQQSGERGVAYKKVFLLAFIFYRLRVKALLVERCIEQLLNAMQFLRMH